MAFDTVPRCVTVYYAAIGKNATEEKVLSTPNTNTPAEWRVRDIL